MKYLGLEALEHFFVKLKALFAVKTDTEMTGTPTINGHMVYHTGNITASDSAPTDILPEGSQHQVY